MTKNGHLDRRPPTTGVGVGFPQTKFYPSLHHQCVDKNTHTEGVEPQTPHVPVHRRRPRAVRRARPCNTVAPALSLLPCGGPLGMVSANVDTSGSTRVAVGFTTCRTWVGFFHRGNPLEKSAAVMERDVTLNTTVRLTTRYHAVVTVWLVESPPLFLPNAQTYKYRVNFV